MSRPDRPARRALRPALMPLEGRQLLTAVPARPATLHVVGSAVPAPTSHAFAPMATPGSAAGLAAHRGGIAARVAPASGALAPSSLTHAVTVHVVTAAVVKAPGVPIHFGPMTPRLYTATQVV